MKDLVREHDRPASSLYTILKQKDQLIAAFEASSSNLERQRLRESRWARLDEALLKWFKDARTIRPPIPKTLSVVLFSCSSSIVKCVPRCDSIQKSTLALKTLNEHGMIMLLSLSLALSLSLSHSLEMYSCITACFNTQMYRDNDVQCRGPNKGFPRL